MKNKIYIIVDTTCCTLMRINVNNVPNLTTGFYNNISKIRSKLFL